MGLSVSDLITAAATELQDSAHTRWSRVELLGYFNAAQRAFADLRPDQMAQERIVALEAGWNQRLPGDVLALLDITHNANVAQRRITKTDQCTLDMVAPAWRSGAPARDVAHFMHDLKTPMQFAVYPPVQAGVQVWAQLALAPADLSDEAQPPGVPVRWMDALREFVLFRAYSKDAEVGSAALAKAHFDLFNNAIGVQAQSAAAVAPTT